MQENNVVNKEKTNQINIKNLKPFLSVFIILLILVTGYYLFWRNITIKTKNLILGQLQDFKYSSVSIGGFPFSKKVIIKNIIFSNDVSLMIKNQIEVKEILFSSFIFSNSLDIKFKNIETINILDSSIYSLNYNEEPVVNISFYSNGNLKSLNYLDMGYRVLNSDNKTLYTSDKSTIKVESIQNEYTLDYTVNLDFQNMQNISIITENNELLSKIEPEIFNLKAAGSYTVTKKDNKVQNSIIKINNFLISGNKNNGFSIVGEIDKDISDNYSYGELKIVLHNYKIILENYRKGILNIVQTDAEASGVSAKEKEEYNKVTNALFNQLLNVIKKNPETKDNNGVLNLSRAKNSSDYMINNESLLNLIQQGLSQVNTK